jgi:CRP-like cAMP-binding protein
MRKISSTHEQKIRALGRSTYFCDLDENVLGKLAEAVELQHFGAGENICWHSDECRGLYIIENGSVKLYKLSTRGRELIIRVLEEGATFNEVPVFDGGANVVNVAALEDSQIWLVEAEPLRRLAIETPELAQIVILNLAHNLRSLVEKMEELSFCQVTTRLARLLTVLTPEELQGEPSERLTQDQMAARLGTVREVVARSLRELERSGAIHMRQRKIHIVNRQALQVWMQDS